MSKAQTVGWLGVGLIVANLVDGDLRPLWSLLTKDGNTSSGQDSGSGGEPWWEKGLKNTLPFLPFADVTTGSGSDSSSGSSGTTTGGTSSPATAGSSPTGTPSTGSGHLVHPGKGRAPVVAPPPSSWVI